MPDKKLKIIISYPPLEGTGTPLLSQNRQFQWFKEPTYIYPVVPASAATLLKEAGFEVIWNDCIAMGWTYERFLDFVRQERPDVIAFETKTPVVKQHWRIIRDIKKLSAFSFQLSAVLFGDHVTALPEESFKNSPVDFVLTGGDYDFLLLSLCEVLQKSPGHQVTRSPEIKLEEGIWYRENGEIKNTGKFQLEHDLSSISQIDRELTQWKRYAYKNGNFKRTPGTYIMSGRDCWWGKCTFCLEPSMKIFTDRGSLSVSEIIDDIDNAKKDTLVLTHSGHFKKITKTYKRFYKGPLINLELFSLKQNIRLTPNHKIFALKRAEIKRCSKKCNWSYLCLPGRTSQRLHCQGCRRKYYKNYSLKFIESGMLQKGDFVAVPIIKKILQKQSIDVMKVLHSEPLLTRTSKKKSAKLIHEILCKYKEGFSQRKIAEMLCLDRHTVKRYITLSKSGQLDIAEKAIIEHHKYIKYEYGKKWIPKKIPLTDDFIRFIGYYLAEGHVSQIKNRPNSYCLCLTFSQKEEDFIKDVVRTIDRRFNKVDVRQHLNKANNTMQVTISSSILAVLFKRLFGNNCYNKKIPQYFLYLPLKKQTELMRGLFRGDAHLRIRGRQKGGTEYIFETTSSIMAHQVIHILVRNKTIPRFRICKPGKKGTVPRYSISLCQYDIEKLFPEIKLPARKVKYRHGFILHNHVLIPIKKVSIEEYSGMVYNLEVEDEHSYTANNVSVSNCSWPTLYPNFRMRTVHNALDEIGALIENYGVKEIMDDTGTFPVGGWLKEFCDGMVERGYNKKIYIDCNMRFGCLTDEDLKRMKKANFRLLLFGLESANQKTLDRLKKNLKADDIIKGCKAARAAGLYPHITIMFGYPWETYDDAKETLKLGSYLLKKGYAYTVQATVVVPYPGSPLFDECKRNGWLNTEDWDRYGMKEPVMKVPMNDKELMGLVREIYKVGFNPEFLFNRVRQVKDLDDIRYFTRAGKKVVGHILDFKGGK